MPDTPRFDHAAVAAPHHAAADTGLRLLAAGANAVEAMIGMAATIAVVYPHMNSIGGDNFWIVADRARRVRAIQACGPAGEGATIEAYRRAGHDTIPTHGPLAALTVPGAVEGWRLAHEMARAFGGTLPLDMILADAIAHARDGVPVSASQARVEASELDGLQGVPGFADAFMPDGKPPAAGAMMRQPRLADTLAQLAHAGLPDFYRGDVGREIAADLERAGSPVTRADLARFEARLREPLRLRLPGTTLFNTPPPTQGLASLVTLGLFEWLGVRRPETFEHLHGLIEASKRATMVRNRVVTDPAFLRYDPDAFLADAWLAAEAERLPRERAGPTPPLYLPGDTIWMGAVDHQGVAVSLIQSVYWAYGSGLVLPGTGVLMQNRGISFSLDPSAVNPLAPGRLPFHTLNPALALFDDGRTMPYGTMGGDAQPQIQAQVFTRHRLGMSLADAIEAPRFVLGRRPGEQEAVVLVEERFDEGLAAWLRGAGHPIERREASHADTFGHAGALLRHPAGWVEAAHDPRSDGGALGL